MAKILIVEDVADNRELIHDILQLSSYEVVEAYNGSTALEVARREHPDLILMDISLPALDGFTVTQQLKANPELATIPVVFVSAHAMERERQRAFEVGGAGYITKPISIHDFVDKVQSYLTNDYQAITNSSSLNLHPI